MKVLAISGSPRKESNTVILLNKVLEPIKKAGIECELMPLSGLKIFGCTACTG
ncbi:MAG: flavodoxin family protein, partial [Fibrobacteres bacterium]|nr:flavodoxin family protein [Fibrobacterota bacterium]